MKSSVLEVLEHLARADSEHVHLSRLVAGVAYALEEYDRLVDIAPKLDRPNEFYAREALQVLDALRTAANPPANWLRGFFYNAAVMRLDAAWERSLRVVLQDKTKANGPALYNLLRQSEPTIPQYDDSIFKRVRVEVNHLKHRDEGPPQETREQPEIVRQGLQQLLALLERLT
jgi:hypothetical protein